MVNAKKDMPVSDFISRASNLVSKVLENQSSQKSGKSVDDIVFYRSNACIHLPLNIGNCSDHNRGYMIIRKRSDKVLGKTLVLSWTSCEAMEKKCWSFFREFGTPGTMEKPSIHPEKQIQSDDHPSNDEVSRSSSVVSSSPSCESFVFDLGRVKSLKVVSDSLDGRTGQVIILSSDGHYKIVHFHDTGLGDFVQVLKEWGFLQNLTSFWRNILWKRRSKQESNTDGSYYLEHFSSTCAFPQPVLLHPDEGRYAPMNRYTWRSFLDAEGRIVDKRQVKKMVFLAGVDPNMRSEVWPFLLDCYDYDLTSAEREEVRKMRRQAYEKINSARASLTKEEFSCILEHHSVVIARDVVRTDRNHPYYLGSDNPNLITLTTILENYALTHQTTGYFQGMSDFLAPLLAEMKDEADAYWCFENAMKRTIFYEMANSINIDKHLAELRELTRLLLPFFYLQAFSTEEGRRMTYCHRWLLICFKRDFQDPDFLKIWESCWSQYDSRHFYLFVCIAVLSIYGDDVVSQGLDDDDTIMLFNSLSMNMDVGIVLKKARALVHQFKTLDSIPCSLYHLIDHVREDFKFIECVGHPDGSDCPYWDSIESWEMV